MVTKYELFVIIINYRYYSLRKNNKRDFMVYARECVDRLHLDKYARPDLMSLLWKRKWEKYNKKTFDNAKERLLKMGEGEKVKILMKVPR